MRVLGTIKLPQIMPAFMALVATLLSPKHQAAAKDQQASIYDPHSSSHSADREVAKGHPQMPLPLCRITVLVLTSCTRPLQQPLQPAQFS